MNNFIYEPGKKFLNPDRILFQAGLTAGQVAADLGAGSGYFTIAAGQIVGSNGKVFSVDILESALNHITAEARMKNVKNIKTVRADLEFVSSLDTISTGSCDCVMLVNILHQIAHKPELIKITYRLLKTGGKVLIIDWNNEPFPLGPQASERVSDEAVKKLMEAANFKLTSHLDTDMYHYGLLFVK